MMLRRWFLLSRARRERSRAATAMDAFRFETLEQRTCMANDLDASPLRSIPLDIGSSYQTTTPSSYSANDSSDNGLAVSYSLSRMRVDEIICLIEPTYETFTYDIDDIELCIDPSVGPRLEPVSRIKLLNTADNLVLADKSLDSLAFNQQGTVNSAGERSLWNYSSNFEGAQGAGAFRPKLVDLPQTIVVDTGGEGESEDAPRVPTMQMDPSSPPTLTTRTAKHGEAVEHQPAARKASFVAAIDWSHAAKTDELISVPAVGSDEAIPDQLNGRTNGQPKVTARQSPTADRFGWTGLLASKISNSAQSASPVDNESESRTVGNELRPIMAALPGMIATSEVAFEYADTIQAYTRHDEPGRPSITTETLPAAHHQLLPVRTIDESSDATMPNVTVNGVTVAEATALPLGMLLTAEEENETPATSSSRSSRYWYLAAVPAFLALPRRVRDHLPSVPRLKRA